MIGAFIEFLGELLLTAVLGIGLAAIAYILFGEFI